MVLIDFDAFEERAAIIQFDGGLSRFQAETLAAEAQGFTRWQVMEVKRENSKRDFAGSGDQRQAATRDAANNLPGMQSHAAQEERSMPKRDVQAGRDRLEVLALPVRGGGLL